MNKRITDFYDNLSAYYHLIYADWEKSIDIQANALNRLIRKQGFDKNSLILDCACGIGTQSIGLAKRGYKITGTDISREEIKRAKKEAKKFNVRIKFKVCAFSELSKHYEYKFDILICCDNAIAHLISNHEMQKAVKNFYKCLKKDGLLIISTRDYDETMKKRPTNTPIQFYKNRYGKRIHFQIWEWDSIKPIYQLYHFILIKETNRWKTVVNRVKYRAYKRIELNKIFRHHKFRQIRWIFSKESKFFQPIMIARK